MRKLNQGGCVAIGNFDGLHTGHLPVIKLLQQYKSSGQAVALINIYEDGPHLTTPQEQRYILERLGISEYSWVALADMEQLTLQADIKEELERAEIGVTATVFEQERKSQAENFSRFISALNVVVREKGYKTVIADKRLGLSAPQIQALEAIEGCQIIIVDTTDLSEEIRRLLENGQLEDANRLLGYNYLIMGEVIPGRAQGRTVNMPTANIKTGRKLLPMYGVYATLTTVEGEHYGGLSNIGIRPAMDDDKEPTVEVYILDFRKTIYGQIVLIELTDYIRPELKLENLQAVRLQVDKDVIAVEEKLKRLLKEKKKD